MHTMRLFHTICLFVLLLAARSYENLVNLRGNDNEDVSRRLINVGACFPRECIAKMNDGTCDQECNTAGCYNDGGDCQGCVDSPSNWVDSVGDDCDDYQNNNWCDIYGDDITYENVGKTASKVSLNNMHNTALRSNKIEEKITCSIDIFLTNLFLPNPNEQGLLRLRWWE